MKPQVVPLSRFWPDVCGCVPAQFSAAAPSLPPTRIESRSSAPAPAEKRLPPIPPASARLSLSVRWRISATPDPIAIPPPEATSAAPPPCVARATFPWIVVCSSVSGANDETPPPKPPPSAPGPPGSARLPAISVRRIVSVPFVWSMPPPRAPLALRARLPVIASRSSVSSAPWLLMPPPPPPSSALTPPRIVRSRISTVPPAVSSTRPRPPPSITVARDPLPANSALPLIAGSGETGR